MMMKSASHTRDPHAAGAPPAAPDRAGARVLAFALVAFIAIVHVWIISAGRMSNWPSYGASVNPAYQNLGYYSLLADGFARGQTHLSLHPDPRLLALPDPYDPVASEPLKFHDAVLYNGKYYLYWGPVPALLLVPYKIFRTAGAPVMFGDQYLVFAFSIGTLIFAGLLILRIRERFFPRQRWWTIAFGVLMLGLVNPIPFTLARAAVYEAAIFGGQCFVMAGLYCAFVGLDPVRTGRGNEPAAPKPVWLALAAVCFSMAVGSRLSLAPAVALLGAMVLWRLARRRPTSPRGGAVACFAAFLFPALIGALLLGWYNFSRFGSPTETGFQYQLSSINMHSGPASERLFWIGFLPANFLRYLAEPVQWRGEFPYALAGIARALSYARIKLPRFYNVEPVVGLIFGSPIFIFAIAALVPRFWRRAAPVDSAFDISLRPIRRWLVGSLIVVVAVGFAPNLFLNASTMRYLCDLSPSLSVLSAIGLWLLLCSSLSPVRGGEGRDEGPDVERACREGPSPYALPRVQGRGDRGVCSEDNLSTLPTPHFGRRIWVTAASILLAYSMIAAILMALTGYFDHFAQFNPALMDHLSKVMSLRK